ncbi:MAG TPA: peptidoglycan DD-metalloendopeptidase family protein [bacterium]|nr:peptidoglycan DD-metalloendopeptidase family protein [bacterium]
MKKDVHLIEKRIKQIHIIEIILIVFLISGCSLTIGTKYPEKKSSSTKKATTAKQTNGVWHTVKKGENLYRISLYYQVSQQEIKKSNKMKDDNVVAGQKLFIPTTKKQPPAYALTPDTTTSSSVKQFQKDGNSSVPDVKILKDTEFIWPVSGKIICNYGELGNKGIDILTQPSSPVKAARNGKVAFTGNTTKYGETIIIEHDNDIFSIYGHDLIVKVKQGQSVKTGAIIGEMKNSGQARRYLHFEIRYKNQSVNPLNYLPQN